MFNTLIKQKMKTLISTYICFLIGLQVVCQPLTQSIFGNIKDEISQTPLIGATVKILDTEPLMGGVSDPEGNFIIRNVPLGRHKIEIAFVGYETQFVPEILVTSGKAVQLNVKMKESIIAIDEIVVRATIDKEKPINEMAVVSAKSFTVEESRRYAGGFDDPARLAQAFAGVSANTIGDNGIQIRGNAPKGVLWRVEGVEVSSPSHFNGADVSGGGFLTLLSSHVLDNSDFFTGAFPSEYGNALAGIFDINLRTGNNFQRENTFQAGLLGIDFSSEGPFKKGGTGTYLFNYRYSTFGLIHPLLPEDAAYLNYQDLSYKLHFPTKIGTFQLWGLNGHDRAETRNELLSDSTTWETWDDFGNNDFGFLLSTSGLNHKLVIGDNTFIRSSVAFSLNDGYYKEDLISTSNTILPDKRINQLYQNFITSTQVNQKFSPRFNIRTGFIYNFLNYDLKIKDAQDKGEPLQLVANDNGSTNRYQFYTNGQWHVGANITLNAGFHGQYVQLIDEMTMEPRLGIQWNYNSNSSLSFGYGKHSQMEDIKTYFVVDETGQFVNKSLGLAKAHHFVLGWDRQLSAFSRIKIEPYVQFLYDVPVISDSTFSMLNFVQDWYFDGDLINAGKGLNYGVDLTLERFLNDDYYYLITGSLFKSRYMDANDQWHDTRYDRGFNFDFLFGKEWKINGSKNKFIGFNSRLNLMGGLKNSPLDVNSSLAEQTEILDETSPYTQQDAMVYFLDLSVTHRKNKEKYSSVWALQLKNALGSKSFYGHTYNYRTDTIDKDSLAVVLPNISWKIEF